MDDWRRHCCVLIAIHRYFAVVHPMKRPFHSKTKCIIAAIWIFSSLQCGSSFYFFSTVGQGDNLYCDVPTKIMSTFIISSYSNIALTIGLPPLLITVAYALTVYKLYQHKVPGIQDNLTKRKRKQQNKKVLKMCLAVVAALYFSFGFRFIFLVLDRQGKLSHFSKTVHMDLENMSIFILSLILIYNFFIYLIFNGIYRDNIKTMITRCCSFTYSQFGSGIRSIPKAYSGEQMREIPHNGLQNHI
ncbi:prokineticin receptor 2 [Exaiptasia diaphana]|uniref:G-protein coupled receptors family 1 profile domain-containing protein n=1 Tax=Exaiptasia diaphana TaxID=2652724 RepID=A0A913XHY8_EXADI|nr:prokineticin receptor 2 [Exaiptasia diaphana]